VRYNLPAGIFADPDVSTRASVYAPIDESGHVTKHGRHRKGQQNEFDRRDRDPR
jgi:hypothetical protein